MTLNTLFVSAGRRVELVHAFRAAQARLSLEGVLVGLDADPLAPALQVVDRACLVPRRDDPQFIETLLSLCRTHRPALVLPLTDPDVMLLAQHGTVLEAVGARIAACGIEAARVADDKVETGQFFGRLGLPTPPTWLPDALPADARFPLFVKDRHGSAGKATARVANADELSHALLTVRNPIVQTFVHGVETTHDVVCDLAGDLMAVVSRQRLEVRNGEVTKGVTVWDAETAEACATIARMLPAIGPITVQTITAKGKTWFIEINARLGGGLPLTLAAGVDVPGLLLARTAGIQMHAPERGAYQVGLHMTRCDQSFFLGPEAIKSLSFHDQTPQYPER